MIEPNKEDDLALAKIPCIYYPLCFQKDTIEAKALIDSGNEINAMTLIYVSKLNLRVHRINVGGWKIETSTLKTFEMVLPSFQVEDKLKKAQLY